MCRRGNVSRGAKTEPLSISFVAVLELRTRVVWKSRDEGRGAGATCLARACVTRGCRSRHCEERGLLVDSQCARRRNAAGDTDMAPVAKANV